MKISKILAGLSAAALAASMLSMAVSADETAEPAAVDGVAFFTNQFTSWTAYNAELTLGTADYDLSPANAEGGFTNLGYVQDMAVDDYGDHSIRLDEKYVVTVNSITINGIEFSDAGGELTGIKDEDGEHNGLMNQWWGENGADIDSDDGSATIVFASTGLTLVVGEDTQDITSVIYNITVEENEAPVTPFEAPEGAIFFKDEGWWGAPDLGEEVNGSVVEGAWVGDGFSLSLAREGYTFTITDDAKVFIVVQTEEPADADALISKYGDTTLDEGATVYRAAGDEADNIYLFEIPFADYIADENVQVGELNDWFASNMQFGDFTNLGAKVWIYATGIEYTPDETPVESEVESESEAESSAAPTDSKKADSSSKAATTATTTNPGTGAAALAVTGIALAGAAVVASKKRK